MYELLELEGPWGEEMGFTLPVDLLGHDTQEEIRVNLFPGVAYVIGMTRKLDEDEMVNLQQNIQDKISPYIVGVIPEHIHPAIRVVALSLLVSEFIERYLGIEHVITHGLCYMTLWYMMLKEMSYFSTEEELENWWTVMRADLFQRLAMTDVPVPDNLQAYVHDVMQNAEGLVGNTLIEVLCATGGEVV
jgi:hypothetical protein